MIIDFKILEPIGAIVFLIGCIPQDPPQSVDFLNNWMFWIIGSILILLSNINFKIAEKDTKTKNE